MAVNLAELLALPAEERSKLAEALLASVAPPDLASLVAEFSARAERVTRELDATSRRMEELNDSLERDRAEVRESVLRAGEEWPFDLPPTSR